MCYLNLLRAVLFALPLMLLASCEQQFDRNNYKAYFGGEIINPTSRYVLFCQGNTVIDTIPLKDNNTFFKTFDSLAPGMYSFRHNPEYQNVYFDKNDSLMVHVNTKNFDESIVFCGRGDQKNNFLMETYLKNEAYRNTIYTAFDYDVERFTKTIDASHSKLREFYVSAKEEIKWSDDFDVYARAATDYTIYATKELYPIAHQIRNGNSNQKVPSNYYDYRQDINFNNSLLANYPPYVSYLSHMLNNVANSKEDRTNPKTVDKTLQTNIAKMEIADTLIKDSGIKNTVLNNIAFNYLLEDQNMGNNQRFLETFHKYSTDKSQKNEITRIGNAILLLEAGKPLPEVMFIDKSGKAVSSNSFKGKKTVIFCWSDRLNSHFIAVHKKVLDLSKKYPDYQFVAVNLDNDQEKWTKTLARYNFPGIIQYRCQNFDSIKDKWAITKIHRTIVLNADGTIKNAFTNVFDPYFEQQLIGSVSSKQSQLAVVNSMQSQ